MKILEYSNSRKKSEYYFYLFLVFILLLNIPKISVGFVIFAMLIKFFGLLKIKNNRISKKFFSNFILLFAFCLSYFLISYSYGYRDLYDVIKYIILIMSSYAIGYSICQKNTVKWPYGLIWINLSFVTGAVLIAFLSVYFSIGLTSNINIVGRQVPYLWIDYEVMGGPGLGALASLGICLIPILFFGEREGLSKQSFNFMFIVILILTSVGLYANIAMQNRTPFVALIVSFFFAGFIFFVSKGKITKAKLIKLMTAFIILGYLGYFLKNNYELLSQYAIYNRFINEGLRTSRYYIWPIMLKSLIDGSSLLGGKAFYISEIWVHNLWLDAAYEAGILPLLFLLFFHIRHIKPIVRIIRSKLPILIKFIFSSISISFLVTFIQEPTLSASLIYFSASCLFLGLVLRLSDEQKLYSISIASHEKS